MPTEQTYKLEVHIDSQQISLNDLTERVEKALSTYTAKIQVEINEVKDKNKTLYNRIFLKGSLEDIDECHYQLEETQILTQEPLNFYRYLDEAGDKIRYLAYPILVEIEQKIRGFISRAIAEIWGFNWWSSHPPENIAQRINRTYTQNNQYSRLHPLECATFEDLIGIFTAKLPSWQNDQTLTVNDLSELLNNCDSVEEIKEYLQEKTQERSYWNNVFSKYFDDSQEWKQIEKDLNTYILRERNKVMHHRPMRLSVVGALLKKRDKIIQFINTFAKIKACKNFGKTRKIPHT